MRYGQITQVYASGGAQIWDLGEERRYKADLCDIPRSERPAIGAVVSFELDEEKVATSVKALSPEEHPAGLRPLEPVPQIPDSEEAAVGAASYSEPRQVLRSTEPEAT